MARSPFQSLNLDPAEVRRIQLDANRAWMSVPKNRRLHNIGLFAGIVCALILAALFGPIPIGGIAGAVVSVITAGLVWVIPFGIMIAVTMKSRREAIYVQLRKEGHHV